jgi:hypothetical protein
MQLFLIVVLVVIIFSRIRLLLDKHVPAEYRPVMHAFFAEMAVSTQISVAACEPRVAVSCFEHGNRHYSLAAVHTSFFYLPAHIFNQE